MRHYHEAISVKQFLAVLSLPLLLGAGPAQPDSSAANIKADMAFLASDGLKGREAGSPEFNKAADYVAARMKQIGLKPGGKGGYFQPVPMVAFRPRDEGVIAL